MNFEGLPESRYRLIGQMDLATHITDGHSGTHVEDIFSETMSLMFAFWYRWEVLIKDFLTVGTVPTLELDDQINRSVMNGQVTYASQALIMLFPLLKTTVRTTLRGIHCLHLNHNFIFRDFLF